jgi:hypothetical protein
LLTSSKPADALEGSTKVLLFGGFISLLLLALWIPSALAFPIAVGWIEIGNLPFTFHVHFFLSLALCGCAATAYPYFLITFMASHYFVPALVRSNAIRGPRRYDLMRVALLNQVHLYAAAAVPLLGALLIAIVLAMHEETKPWPLIVVSGGGLAGLAAVAWLRRLIELDLAALDHIAFDESRASAAMRSSHGRSSHRPPSRRP